ncbi:hypothetical protein KSP39_PZI016660 [Platanthera zijinensis]|uniref:WEB family protein n=1 Tax=Platanthera zijinensis TaxID=2320716 RepID=A0AAP0B6W3_9ASPA
MEVTGSFNERNEEPNEICKGLDVIEDGIHKRSVRVSETEQQLSELHAELKRAREERSRALEEIAEFKRVSEKSMQGIDKIRLIELQAKKAAESENKMLESMIHQTKQLEQAKISLEETKLELRNLQESIKMMEDLDNKKSLDSVGGAQQEMMKLRNDLRLALEAEEESKKAMDSLAVALMEVTSETNYVKIELAKRQSELERTRDEAKSDNILLKIAEQKLLEALDAFDKKNLEYEESVSTWMKKEYYFVSCLRISEEELTKEKQENSRISTSWKVAKEENMKMRDIMKQAVNEAAMVKEALETARNENYQLKNQLFEKEISLQQARQDYESIKVSESAALDRVKELKILFASSSAMDPKKKSNSADVGSFRIAKGVIQNAKMNRCLKIFPSEREKPDYRLIKNHHRHSTGEPAMFGGSSIVVKEGNHETNNTMVSSSSTVSNIRVPLFCDERGVLNSDKSDRLKMIVNGDLKKKKTLLGKLTGSLRRRSNHN